MIDLNALSLPELFEALTADGSLDRLLDAALREDLADVGDVTTTSMLGGGREVRAAAGPTRWRSAVEFRPQGRNRLRPGGGAADPRRVRLHRGDRAAGHRW